MELFAALNDGVLSADVMPLYALLVAIYEAIGGRPSYPVAVASAQLVRALEHLGFEAELVPASIAVAHEGEKRIMSIGAWEHPPMVRDDGTTDGHVVVWADSFKRCIDLSVCNHPMLLESSSDDQKLTMPIILPVAGGLEELLDKSRQHVLPRPPFMMMWIFIPQWKSYFNSFLSRHMPVIEDGGLALAKVAIDLLSAIAVYSDMSRLNQRYPWLAEMLSGQMDLPSSDRKSYLYQSDQGTSADAWPTQPSVFRTRDE
jgi:hypothetical protein